MRISDWSSDVCSSDLGVVGQLAADQLADQRIALDGVDELPAVAKVGHITAGVREDDLVELLVDFRLADQAGEGRAAGAGRQHVQALARGQRVEPPRDRKTKRLNSGHQCATRMPYSA